MVDIKIKEDFFIEPKYLNQPFQTVVEDTVGKNKRYTCSKNYGFIKDVKHVTILNNIISTNNNACIIVTVEYIATTEKPHVGKSYTSTRTLFYNEKQLLVDVDGIFSILITNCVLEKNKCTFKTCCCVFDLSFEHVHSIKLNIVDFKEGKFMTIGEHVH